VLADYFWQLFEMTYLREFTFPALEVKHIKSLLLILKNRNHGNRFISRSGSSRNFSHPTLWCLDAPYRRSAEVSKINFAGAQKSE